jgi:small subunit ribosomal protein S1
MQVAQMQPTQEDFAALLQESFMENDIAEGTVVKGRVVAIEKDVAVIDVGLKVEGRVPLKEFGVRGRDGVLNPGDEVEVYLERVENALGEAMLSREKARREESWVRSEVMFENNEPSPARSSTRSRAASPSTSTAPWPSCRAARSMCARCAMSGR